MGINNSGQITGSYRDKTGGHGFIYDIATGTYTTVDDPNATDIVDGTGVMAINDYGQAVGVFYDVRGEEGFFAKVAPRETFAGTPGTHNCHGQSVSALDQQYGGVAAAAAALCGG
jgi:hypothetical protein